MSFLKFHILLIITRWSHYVGRHDNLDLPNLHVLHHLHHDIDEVRYLDEVVLDHVLHITKIKWSYQRRIYKRVTVWFHYADWHETKPNRSKQPAYHRRNWAIKLGVPNSTPIDINFDLLEVFSWKTTPQRDPILVLFPQFCSLLAPFCSLLGVTKAPPGPFLRCAYGSRQNFLVETQSMRALYLECT